MEQNILHIRDRLNLAIESLKHALKECHALREQSDNDPNQLRMIRIRIIKLTEMLSQASIYSSYLDDVQQGRIVKSMYFSAALNTINRFSKRINTLLN